MLAISKIYFTTFIFLWIFSQKSISQITIELEKEVDYTSDTISFVVNVKTASEKPVKIVKPCITCPLYYNKESWTLHFIYNDSIYMEFPGFYRYQYNLSKNDYIKISKTNPFSFKTNVEMNYLQTPIKTPEELDYTKKDKNFNYGTYKLYITYYDALKFGKSKQFKSNEVVVVYKKQ
jgi:hypothetical protein